MIVGKKVNCSFGTCILLINCAFQSFLSIGLTFITFLFFRYINGLLVHFYPFYHNFQDLIAIVFTVNVRDSANCILNTLSL